jgi:membrane associated rhomboid family serine protease
MNVLDDKNEKVFNAPPVTKYLVISLIVVHILLLVTDNQTLIWVYENFAFSMGRLQQFLNGSDDIGIVPILFTLCSHMFLHHDFMHLLINAFMLLAFGAMVERYYGVMTFITIFLLSGWAGALGEYAVSTETAGILYGASGAVFGMMGATMRLMLPRLGWHKVISFAAVMMGLNLIIGLTPIAHLLVGEDVSISWAAHLGGFVVGTLLSLIFRPGNNVSG